MIEDHLELRPEGVLMASHWDASLKKFCETNVTHLAPALLYEITTLGAGVTLKDIFLLIDQHLILKKILGNWADEFVKEGLQGNSSTTKLVNLSLKWNVTYRKPSPASENQIGTIVEGLHFPTMVGFDKDQKLYSLCFAKASELASLPISLDHIITFSNEEDPAKPEKLTAATFTLGQILHSVIWSLSFWGPPKVRDAKYQNLLARIESAKDSSDLISWEELKNRLLADRSSSKKST